MFTGLSPKRRWDTVMPYPRLESSYLPDENRVLAACREVLTYD
jgi:pyruvate/2-oxoglutarate/acetoin dehydrogenase E1 component